MKEWRTLLLLEYDWRLLRIYRKILNGSVKKGTKLSSPKLCKLNARLNKHAAHITKLKDLYEKKTGRVIVFYNCDDL